jgi:hypothetical protein
LVSQSKTGSLSQPPTPQAPLFLHPEGNPLLPEEQLVHPIQPQVYIYEQILAFGIPQQHIAKQN